MLVGEQATEFAEQMGFKRESLSTPKSKDIWKEWKQNRCQVGFDLIKIDFPPTIIGDY